MNTFFQLWVFCVWRKRGGLSLQNVTKKGKTTTQTTCDQDSSACSEFYIRITTMWSITNCRRLSAVSFPGNANLLQRISIAKETSPSKSVDRISIIVRITMRKQIRIQINRKRRANLWTIMVWDLLVGSCFPVLCNGADGARRMNKKFQNSDFGPLMLLNQIGISSSLWDAVINLNRSSLFRAFANKHIFATQRP